MGDMITSRLESSKIFALTERLPHQALPQELSRLFAPMENVHLYKSLCAVLPQLETFDLPWDFQKVSQEEYVKSQAYFSWCSNLDFGNQQTCLQVPCSNWHQLKGYGTHKTQEWGENRWYRSAILLQPGVSSIQELINIGIVSFKNIVHQSLLCSYEHVWMPEHDTHFFGFLSHSVSQFAWR